MSRYFSSTHYFYSLDLNSDIKTLSTSNLVKDFRENKDFMEKFTTNRKIYNNPEKRDKNGNFLILSIL